METLDFWSGTTRSYHCSKHGAQPPGLKFDLPAVDIQRHYCIKCLIEVMDELCQQLTEIRD